MGGIDKRFEDLDIVAIVDGVGVDSVGVGHVEISSGKGSQSGDSRSDDCNTGSQYRRSALPIGVSGPTRQISSLFSRVSMTGLAIV